jgi:hypothetical protein
MPATLKVKSVDAAVRTQREATAKRVLDYFGSCLPPSRLLCFLDDDDPPDLRREFGPANRGVYGPIVLFLRVDARFQIRPCTPSLSGWLPPSCPDRSQYWFAKYELERRKPEAQRSTFDITHTDAKEDIAWKLTQHGFRAASRKYHPDHGDDTAIMQSINNARDLIKTLLKK